MEYLIFLSYIFLSGIFLSYIFLSGSAVIRFSHHNSFYWMPEFSR